MQVRRGADRAEIYSLAFSSTAQWLAVSSDKGTIHVFGLKLNLSQANDVSRSSSDSSMAVTSSASSLSFIKGNVRMFTAGYIIDFNLAVQNVLMLPLK